MLPIKANDFVLEVGSGGNPHPWSDVLLEKYIDNSHRLKAIKIDRQMILADACRMPFKDKSFDYLIAFHVLEHISTPDLFLNEMMRVSSAGYIETPNVLYERMKPLDMHLLEVSESNGIIRIHKKPNAVPDSYISSLNLLSTSREWKRIFELKPKAFHMCYKWNGEIRYEIDNNEQSLSWFLEPLPGYLITTGDNRVLETTGSKLRNLVISLFRGWALVRKRNKVLLEDILVCPTCRLSLQRRPRIYYCVNCSHSYRREPIIDFTAPLNEVESHLLKRYEA